MKKLFTFVLALALFVTCIPTSWAATAVISPKQQQVIWIYQTGSKSLYLGVEKGQENTKSAPIRATELDKSSRNQMFVLTKYNTEWWYIHLIAYGSARVERDFVLDAGNSDSVGQYTRVDGKANQLWKLIPAESGGFRFMNMNGKYLAFNQSTGGYVMSAFKNNSTQVFKFYAAPGVTAPAFLKNIPMVSGSTQATAVVNKAIQYVGYTRSQMNFTDDWCSRFVARVGQEAGANFPRPSLAGTPVDVARWFVNNNAGVFYCFSDNNYRDIIRRGVTKPNNIVRTSRNSFVPKQGDLICFLFTYDIGRYSWSHIAVLRSDYAANGIIQTIEGNTGGGQGRVGTFNRPYDTQVVGIIRPNYT